MSKKYQVPLKIYRGLIRVGGVDTNITLPPRCKGILFVFETKKAAKDFMGKDSDLLEVEEIAKED